MDGGESGKVFENPPDKLMIILMTIVAIISFSVGIWLQDMIFLVIFIIVGGVMVFALIWTEFYHRPNTIRIFEDGLDFNFRWSPDQSFKWEDIQGIYVSKQGFNSISPGGIQLKKNEVFHLSFQTANAIWHAYQRETGNTPPKKRY